MPQGMTRCSVFLLISLAWIADGDVDVAPSAVKEIDAAICETLSATLLPSFPAVLKVTSLLFEQQDTIRDLSLGIMTGSYAIAGIGDTAGVDRTLRVKRTAHHRNESRSARGRRAA